MDDQRRCPLVVPGSVPVRRTGIGLLARLDPGLVALRLGWSRRLPRVGAIARLVFGITGILPAARVGFGRSLPVVPRVGHRQWPSSKTTLRLALSVVSPGATAVSDSVFARAIAIIGIGIGGR